MASWRRARVRSGVAIACLAVMVSIPSLAGVVHVDHSAGDLTPGFPSSQRAHDDAEGALILAQAPSPPTSRPPVPAGGGSAGGGGSVAGSPSSTTGGADTPAAARLAVRISDLESALRDSTGRVEELTFRVKQLEERLDKLSSDVEYRFSQQGSGAGQSGGGSPGVGSTGGGSTGGATSGSASNPPGPKVLGPASSGTAQSDTPPPAASASSANAATPREAYAVAYSLLQQGKQAEAEAGFKDFLKRFPDDPLASNARYWLGETYYARNDYSSAAVAFLDAYEKDKRGAKAPDALLKLGLSLSGLNKSDQACATFKELARAFPDASQAIKDRAAQERKRLNCPG